VTVRVLERGLPVLPERLEPSGTVPVALWRGARHGAVLFVRLWRNGNIDSDCAIAGRGDDGRWMEPTFMAGGAWIDDPLVRPALGWDGASVLWLGDVGMGDVRAVQGAASEQVAGIEVEQAGRTWTVPVGSPCGAFVVGVELPGPASVRAVGADGRVLRGSEPFGF
jgi:hypothetical protein